MQILIVALLVVGCAGYALWTLMPAALRRPLASALLAKLPVLPAALRRKLDAAARTAGGCGCDGCDHAAKPSKAAPAEPQARPITFHPRAPR